MNNLRSTKIGLAALTIIFLILYGYFSTLGKPPAMAPTPANQGFKMDKIILGNLGGFHILKNIDYSDEGQFYRLIIATELNRSTASPEDITIPYTAITETENLNLDAKTPAANNSSVISSPYQIRINLSDTQVADIPKDRPLAIFEEINTKTDQPKLIQEVRVTESKDEGVVVVISLTKKSLFRATADNSGTIVLDILK